MSLSDNREWDPYKLTPSEKVEIINRLPAREDHDALVQEIQALRALTPEERGSLFGVPDILYIIENYGIASIKQQATKLLTRPELHRGSVVAFNLAGTRGIVLSIDGSVRDRLQVLYKDGGRYMVAYGVSVYDVTREGECGPGAVAGIDEILGTGEAEQ